MPYIVQRRRKTYEGALAELSETIDKDTPDGDLNYVITRLLVDWLAKRGKSYATIADVVKVLETAKLEFYRRVAAPYEDEKAKVNGDVYDESTKPS